MLNSLINFVNKEMFGRAMRWEVGIVFKSSTVP